tara:strand:- start:964 stop:1089 length:126 start_codon:yes stop_codon:yes gene_type:complete
VTTKKKIKYKKQEGDESPVELYSSKKKKGKHRLAKKKLNKG